MTPAGVGGVATLSDAAVVGHGHGTDAGRSRVVAAGVDVATVDDGRWLSVDTVGAGAVVRVAPAHASDATPTTAYRHGRPNCVTSVRMVIAGEYALFVSNMQYVQVSPDIART